ncbi:MAG: glycosyl hydrolase family 28-related protein [Armatimonadota bacterium]
MRFLVEKINVLMLILAGWSDRRLPAGKYLVGVSDAHSNLPARMVRLRSPQVRAVRPLEQENGGGGRIKQWERGILLLMYRFALRLPAKVLPGMVLLAIFLAAGVAPARPPIPPPTLCTADPCYASRLLSKEERDELAVVLGKYRAQVVEFYDLGEMDAYAGSRTALAAALERGGAPEAAKTAREIRVLHGPPEVLSGLREVEQARQVAIYALNFKYKGAPVVIINGGAGLRETLLHETFAGTYPELNADEVAKKVDEFLLVKAPAAYQDALRQNPDKPMPGLQAWLFGPLAVPPAFAQQFWTKPAEWARWGKGSSTFAWSDRDLLTATTKNSAKGEVDEYLRPCAAPLTERDAFTFTGYFQLQSAGYGTAKRASQVFSLGTFILGKTTFSRGMAVVLDATPEGSTLTAVIGLGKEKAEATGNPVTLAMNTLYAVQVTYYPTADRQCVLAANVLAADGSLVGTSTVTCPLRPGFFADRLSLGSHPLLTDGGTLTVRWYSVSVEPEVLPIFRTALYQGRARVDPGDLVQLCGARLTGDLQVVYQRVTDLAHPPALPPTAALTETTEEHGKFTLASTKGLPYSLVALAPACLKGGQAYALWVGKPDFVWSPPALVNDARPAWISPDFARPGEEVTVVGRNLDPMTDKTVVRLRGPETYNLTAKNDGKPETAIETYAARMTLPADAKPGVYTAEVCRDGTNWVLLEGRTLTLYPPIPKLKRYDATKYGATPNDATDDTAAITEAIADAAKVSGEVYLPAGTYLVTPLVLTQGVSLTGAGMNETCLTLQYPDVFVHKGWGSANTRAIVSACGYQMIRNLGFYDPLGPKRDETQNTSSLGIALGELGKGGPPADYVHITGCRFVDTNHGIRLVWAKAVRRCTITDNYFQPRQVGILIGGLSNAVIRRNTFLPSTAGWTYPSELSGAYQVDFSDNVSDGSVNGGWRNGYFWNLSGSVENNLVCNNRTSRDGDKGTGNGESFAYDANGDILPYMGASIAGTPETIVLPAGWTVANKYAGCWVRVVDGKGLGQSRKIVAHTGGPLNLLQLSVPWDVLPDAGSALAVTNLYWQVYTVDNLVDERENTNPKSKAGVVTPYGSSSECVVDSNRLYNTEGIMLYTCGKSDAFTANYFTEVRRNLLDGRTSGPGSYGGIFMWYGAEDKKPSSILGYGTVITGNIIRDCDYNGQGAISSHPCWSHPTTPSCWKEALIFNNRISDVPTGVQIQESYTWNTVLFRNTLTNVPTPLTDRGKGTVQVKEP